MNSFSKSILRINRVLKLSYNCKTSQQLGCLLPKHLAFLTCNVLNSTNNTQKILFIYSRGLETTSSSKRISKKIANKSNLYLYNQQFYKMMRIRFEESSMKVAISLRCKITSESEREFNLSRNFDEPLSVTFQKLYNNFSKQSAAKSKKKLKKENDETELAAMNTDQNSLPLSLHDLNDQPLPLETKNIDAWKEDYVFKLNDQSFKVTVNLPEIKKISLPKCLIAGMPAIAKIDADTLELTEVLNTNSIFSWYCSKDVIANTNKDLISINKKLNLAQHEIEKLEWKLLAEGVSKKYCILDEDCEQRLIKVECVPSDGKRKGIAVQHISSHVALEKLDLEKFPMTERHKLTTNVLGSDSLRVMTYNILASCYSDTALAREELFVYCPLEYLDFKYRRVLLIHEIKNFNSDVIFLQECEQDFFEEDLKNALPEFCHKFKGKGTTREGEAIIFRSDRFKFIKTHDICITDELKTNPLFQNLWTEVSKNEQLKAYILARTTILQVVQVESLNNPGVHYLFANTHLFFHPEADFIRLIQTVVNAKYLEKLKYDLLYGPSNENKSIKDVKVIFGGDFNSDPPSYAFNYLFTQCIPFDLLKAEEKEILKECSEELIHSLNLSAYTNFPFTNCIAKFEGVLDYVFYDSNSFELTKVIPLPSVEKLKENVALPSRYIPSDHLPLIFELKIKN